MKKTAVLLLILLLFLMPASSRAKEKETYLPDTWYDLLPQIQLAEGEELVLALPRSYYSGEPVYKGTNGAVLSGACALHSASVVLSNLSGEESGSPAAGSTMWPGASSPLGMR